MKSLPIFFTFLLFLQALHTASAQTASMSQTEIMILGIAQDAGYPQANCQKSCCQQAWSKREKARTTASIALIDHEAKTFFIIDATPDFKYQLQSVINKTGYELGGILLTHAHIGHYTGLMHLGHEAMGANGVLVFALPRMADFLKNNGPWSQLVTFGNIRLVAISTGKPVSLTHNITITPWLVPHRDEFSETAGYLIRGMEKDGWYIPDIDKWELWDKDLVKQTEKDFLIVDGTFYKDGEIPGRNMSDIPHPFIQETMKILAPLELERRQKVHFIHFNHTNPALWSPEVREKIMSEGFHLCEEGQIIRI